jgi:hypothetical protein
VTPHRRPPSASSHATPSPPSALSHLARSASCRRALFLPPPSPRRTSAGGSTRSSVGAASATRRSSSTTGGRRQPHTASAPPLLSLPGGHGEDRRHPRPRRTRYSSLRAWLWSSSLLASMAVEACTVSMEVLSPLRRWTTRRGRLKERREELQQRR